MLEKIKKYFELRKNVLKENEYKDLKNLIEIFEAKKVSILEESNKIKEEGNLLFKENEYEKALEKYNEALKVDNTNIAVLSNRALVYKKLNKMDLSIEDCKRGLEIEESHIKFYIKLALHYKDIDKKKCLGYCNKGLSYEKNETLLEIKREIGEKSTSVQDLLQNDEIQNYVKDFVKDKSPEDLDKMMKDMMKSFKP